MESTGSDGTDHAAVVEGVWRRFGGAEGLRGVAWSDWVATIR